ncbi:hypothetical protein Tsubulata_044048 [Turnera subulata]|uniref:Protein odr-4 homolog n=1 Tax=Turnera subulata TaxID=218843 RepID=A0A9Q0J0X4_9ROSI|nr:hypothetical protein Tsubulata_044048 [Turnera subulata]
MLVGGVKVIGIYVWVSDTTFKNSTVTLCQAVKLVAEAAPISDANREDRLLIHISYSPRRWTCRNCVLSSNITSNSIRPCDLKMGKVLNSLQSFRCTYNFELRLPVFHENSSKETTLSAILRHGISVLAKELRGATALIDGKLVINEETSTTDGLHEVELLLPFMKSPSIEACSQKDNVGLLVFGGSVCSLAYSYSKEPLSQAVADIKDDIIRSLQSRLDIICDEADGDLGPTDDDGGELNQDKIPRKPVLKEHCVELISVQAPSDNSTIIQPEKEAPSLIIKSFWDVAVPQNSVPGISLEASRKVDRNAVTSRESIKSSNFSVFAAVFILFLSILVGFLLIRQS